MIVKMMDLSSAALFFLGVFNTKMQKDWPKASTQSQLAEDTLLLIDFLEPYPALKVELLTAAFDLCFQIGESLHWPIEELTQEEVDAAIEADPTLKAGVARAMEKIRPKLLHWHFVDILATELGRRRTSIQVEPRATYNKVTLRCGACMGEQVGYPDTGYGQLGAFYLEHGKCV